MVLAATAPAQIVLAAKVDSPPGWIALVSSGATTLATATALVAAYFSYQQARQAGLARRAEHVVPALQTAFSALRALDDALWAIDSLHSEPGPKPHSGYVGDLMRRFDTAVGELQTLEPFVSVMDEPEMHHALHTLVRLAGVAPIRNLDWQSAEGLEELPFRQARSVWETLGTSADPRVPLAWLLSEVQGRLSGLLSEW